MHPYTLADDASPPTSLPRLPLYLNCMRQCLPILEPVPFTCPYRPSHTKPPVVPPWVHDEGTNIELFHHRGVEATLMHVCMSMTLLQAAHDSMVGELLVFLVHCLARFDFDGVVYACGCRPGWPSALTNCILGACNGEFTATVAMVASSSTP
jgi:hypothetical protein